MSQQAFTELVALTRTICQRMQELYDVDDDVEMMVFNRNLSPEFSELIDSWNKIIISMDLCLPKRVIYADVRNTYRTHYFDVIGTLICMFASWHERYNDIFKFIDYSSMGDISMENYALPMSFLISFRSEIYRRPAFLSKLSFINYNMYDEKKCLILNNIPCSESELNKLNSESNLPVLYWHITDDIRTETNQVGKVTLVKGCIDINYLVSLL
jgi:hypothetical protein